MQKNANYPVTGNIRRLIQESGRSQNQVAVDAGMTPQRMSDLLIGRGTIKACKINQISAALGVSAGDLFVQMR